MKKHIDGPPCLEWWLFTAVAGLAVGLGTHDFIWAIVTVALLVALLFTIYEGVKKGTLDAEQIQELQMGEKADR